MPLTTADSLNLHEHHWRPDRAPRAVVVLVHGIAEHAGRYAHVGAFLATAGYALEAFDLRGHGRSEGARAYVEDLDVYLSDLDGFLGRVRSWWPGVPLFLLGHSMGGLIATRYVLARHPLLEGLVLSAPVVAAGEDFPPALLAVLRRLGRVVPRLPVQKLDAGHISHDPATVAAYEADPLITRGWIRAGMGAALLRAQDLVARDEAALALPLLILQGTEDTIANPAGAERLFGNAASADRTLLRYEGYYHEVFNEIGRERVLADLRAWLDARTEPR